MWLAILFAVSLLWLLLGMPLFKSNILNGFVLGMVGSYISAMIDAQANSLLIGGLLFVTGCVIALVSIGYGFPYSHKLFLLSGTCIGWGLIQIVIAFRFKEAR